MSMFVPVVFVVVLDINHFSVAILFIHLRLFRIIHKAAPTSLGSPSIIYTEVKIFDYAPSLTKSRVSTEKVSTKEKNGKQNLNQFGAYIHDVWYSRENESEPIFGMQIIHIKPRTETSNWAQTKDEISPNYMFRFHLNCLTLPHSSNKRSGQQKFHVIPLLFRAERERTAARATKWNSDDTSILYECAVQLARPYSAWCMHSFCEATWTSSNCTACGLLCLRVVKFFCVCRDGVGLLCRPRIFAS